MKFVCSKTHLNHIVTIVQKATVSRSSVPVLECIKIDAQDNGSIKFTSNSIELCIEYTDEVNVFEDGSVALPSKIFGDIVKMLPEGDVEIIANSQTHLTDITCGHSHFNIKGIAPEEFPEAPSVEEMYRVALNKKELKQIIKKVQPFISQLETRKPVLTGALFDIKNGVLTVVGTDSHRLAAIKTKISDAEIEKKFVIPGSALSKISPIIDDEDEDLTMIISDKHVVFNFDKFCVYSRLLEGEFLRYEVILAATNSIKVKTDKQSIIRSLERANLIINDDSSSKTENKMPVKLNIEANRIDISCTTGRGYVNDSVDVEHDGDDLVIGLNCRFMLDSLNACDEEIVMMEFSAPTSGCFIKPEDGSDRYNYMVLPVRLYN